MLAMDLTSAEEGMGGSYLQMQMMEEQQVWCCHFIRIEYTDVIL
jgi:hypothetical protein